MASKQFSISKSQYIKGLQCPKSLWLYRHRPDLAPEVSEATQYIFDSGHEVGELAQKYFAGGIEITDPYYETQNAIASTERAVKNGYDFIYEATAKSPDGAYSRIDILSRVQGTDQWDLIEVKQSTGIKDYYIDDMSLQKYAFVGAGYNIRKSILMHINNEYVREGGLDLKQLFVLEDCTEIVSERILDVKAKLENLINVINSEEEPQLNIGDQCGYPFACDYMHCCWSHIPGYSVYNVLRGSKLERLLAEDIIEINDIPDDYNVTDREAIAINSYKNNSININKNGINEFIGSLVYPLYYLDYETIFPAIPLFDNSKPYQQIPFQFSLHIQKQPGGELQHIEFLHTSNGDPREAFAGTLIKSCGDNGSVVVYNQGFESRINRELGFALPKYKTDLDKINDRMVDLLVPFRSRYLYHPKMQGSASIKSVLPAFVPELSYDELEIGDGGSASLMYLSCIKDSVPAAEKESIYENLKAYCCLDTLAEVRLIEVLNSYL